MTENAGSNGENYLPYRFTGKELDSETGLYYYGARYLDAKYSRWLSCDPALGEYIPHAPISDEAKKHNQNLSGMGGVFNTVNMNLYHYAGNNPVKYTDPDGRETYDSSITKEQYKNSWLLQKDRSWDNVQKFFEDNPNGVLHRPEDQFSFMELEGKNDIVDPNACNVDLVKIIAGVKLFSSYLLPEKKNGEVFPQNPDNFNPEGLHRRDFKNGEIKKWLDKDNKAIYEWNKDPVYGDHYHFTPDGKNRTPGVTGDTHLKPGEIIPKN